MEPAQTPPASRAPLHAGRPRWSNTGLERRVFTVEEANEALAEVRPLAERMVEGRQALAKTTEELEHLHQTIGSNGGDLSPQEVQELYDRAGREALEVAGCVDAIGKLGVQVKDLDQGLVDFPARLDGEDVLLCWHVGEDEIRYWHGVDEGFAGRKPLE
jgi:hypothetical protein